MADNEFLTPEDIFSNNDIEIFPLEIPEWLAKNGKPGLLSLRMLSALELAEYNEAVSGEAKRNAMILVIIRSAVQEDGMTPFFTKAQLAQLQKKSVKALSRIQDKILEINGLRVPDARKNV